MNILKIVEDIKRSMLDERNILMSERNVLSKKISAGSDFLSANKQYSRNELIKAVDILKDTANKLAIIDKKIFDLDICIGTKLEALLSDFEVRVSVAKKRNDMNENIFQNDFVFSLYDDSEKSHITAEDLWILKILKPALKYCNIEIIGKNDE